MLGARSEHLGHVAVATDAEAQRCRRGGIRPRARAASSRSRASPRATRSCGSAPRCRMTGVDRRFDNTYYVVRACHRYDMQARAIAPSSRAECAYLGMTRTAMNRDPVFFDRPAGAGSRPRYLARVVSLDDPESLNRVQVRLIAIRRDRCGRTRRCGRGWSPRSPATTAASSSCPTSDDEVLVVFVQGDPRYPLVLGGLWNGAVPSPASIERRGNNRSSASARRTASRSRSTTSRARKR